MTNIDGVRGGSFSHDKSKKQEIKETKQQINEDIQKDTDLRNDPTQVYGRSQVKSTKRIDSKAFDPKMVENIKGDLELLMKNPKLVVGSDKVFNNRYRPDENYPESVAAQAAFVQEFANKDNEKTH
ncbi:MAG: hypothetical protein ACD_20C00095G0002 [uncultured bacterium]|nr:MAG: hypothetical protein ACD_20C00095G0002 [uncultured bacterium]